MLLRFGFSNHLSVREYQEVSLVASRLREQQEHLVDAPEIGGQVLPVLGVFGANASGKTNLIMGFELLREGILTSHTSLSQDAEDRIPVTPFCLDSHSTDSSSSFDCDFLLDGVRFHYGFVCTSSRIEEEWLYAYPQRYRQVWIQRNVNEDPSFYFGKHLQGQNRAIEKLTRPDSLYVSAAAENNHPQLTAIFNYFRDRFVFRIQPEPLADFELSNHAARFLEMEGVGESLVEILKAADLGIVGYDLKSTRFRLPKSIDEGVQADFFSDLARLFHKYSGSDAETDYETVLETLRQQETKELRLLHQGESGKRIPVSLGLESRGTLHLLYLLGPILDGLKNGRTIFVDEISASMHPLLIRQLISLFTDKSTNTAGAQLIFSTHDTNLLSTDLLRRDAVIIVDKGRIGATAVTTLSDYKVRATDNISRGYLQGRFGGVPSLNRLKALLGSTSE